jgi:hypothetical protein
MVLGVAGAREQEEGDDVSGDQHGDAPDSWGIRRPGRYGLRRDVLHTPGESLEHIALL